MALPMLVTGAPDRARVFDLHMSMRMPRDAEVRWEVPLPLLGCFERVKFRDINVNKKRKTAQVLLPRVREIHLPRVRLPKSARYPTKFIVQPSAGLNRGGHSVALHQHYEGLAVGGVTFHLRPTQKITRRQPAKRRPKR